MAYGFVGFGLLLLIIGSESVVRGGVGLSRAFGLSPLLIGLLIVSAGTSTPELVVALQGTFHGAPDLALGNVVGSNIVNILLILGLGAVMRPIPASPKIVIRDGTALVAASAALFLCVQSGVITQWDGWMFLAGLAVYVVISFVTDWRRPSPMCGAEARAQARSRREMAPAMSTILLIFGFACLYFGGGYVVDGGVALARLYHVPQAVIGLTLVAFGSSLPELATTIAAVIRGETSLAIGNLIGSNIFNILLVVGLTVSIQPLSVSHLVAHADIYVMMAAALVLPLMLASRWRLTRAQGAFLVLGYVAYLGFVAWRQGLISSQFLGTM
jgi:cation:H+ antiporter